MAMRGENWRFWTPVILLVGFAAYCSTKLVCAHLAPQVNSPNYKYERDIPGCRGSIYGACGKAYPFAKSVPTWKYYLDPVSLTNRVVKKRGYPKRTRDGIIRTIADSLSLDFEVVRRMASRSNRRYQYLAASSDPDAYRTITDSGLVSGVAIEDVQVRNYLHKRRLCHVLGSVNAENDGSAGIEQKYNRLLKGVPGKIIGKKDALRREIYDQREEAIAPIPGADIYLTVDHNLQFEVEDALQWGVAEFGAAAGWCVVLDSASGAVLSMASLPDFDPREFGRTPDWRKINRVTNFTYEPGSVMKVITAAAAIDCGKVTPESLYDTRRNDDRYYRLPGDGSHVWDPRITIREAIAKSSNIVIGKLGYDLGPERLWTYMKKFGFGGRTGIELPGEESGILPYWKGWDKVKWSRAPIGQGVSVTALQLASAYQAIANDGVRMQPYIVEKIIGHDGKELHRHEPKELGRPISALTARRVRSMMYDVVSPKGTARRAALRGYSVAGKTGTAQKVINGHYSESLFYATFCGMVPANSPRLVILVTLDFDQRTKFHQGGNSSAPVFKRIANAAVRYLMIAPDRPQDMLEADDEDEFDAILEARAKKYGNELL